MKNVGNIVELTIRDIGVKGEGIGSIEGFTIFVPGALPGERVKVKLSTVKKNYGIAQPIEMVEASLQRVHPLCPVFTQCGGCQLMHLSYEGQLQIKRRRVADALHRIGRMKDIDIAACRPSPLPLGYRNKIQLPVVANAELLELGLFALNSHEVVPIDRCYIHCSLGEEVFRCIKKLLRSEGIVPYDSKSNSGDLRYLLIKSAMVREEVMVIFVSAQAGMKKYEGIAQQLVAACPQVVSVMHNYNNSSSNVILGGTYLTLYGQNYIEEELCGMTFRLSSAAFFQVNPLQAEQLYRCAIELAELRNSDIVLDLYCGVGMLALLVAKAVCSVIGIECVPYAIEDANFNASKAGITNHRFLCGKAEELLKREKHADVVFVNPPRKGCEPAVIAALLLLKPRTIIYISCDPATLARDLALLSAGGYDFSAAYPFDMFPQTTHVETIVKGVYSSK